MPVYRDADEWSAAYSLTRLYVAHRLGERPRRVVAQDEAIKRASDALDDDGSQEAGQARRFLAIEWHAESNRPRGGQPDWEAAIAAVDTEDDAAVRRMARAGMVIRAARHGWLPKGTER